MNKSIVLVHGKPGLGKTTLARSVVNALRQGGVAAEHFSIGERLRAISSGEVVSQFSMQLASQHDTLYRHAHVTDPAIIHGVVGEYLQQTAANVVVIDGHPRYMETAKDYSQATSSLGWRTAGVIVLNGDDNLAGERMKERDRGEHGYTEDILWRLADYAKTMNPVLEWLSQHYETTNVGANLPLEQKTAQVVAAIQPKLATH